MVEYVSEGVFFITLALVNAGLAQIKNNARGGKDLGGFAWFLISLLLGPLATLLIVLFKE